MAQCTPGGDRPPPPPAPHPQEGGGQDGSMAEDQGLGLRGLRAGRLQSPPEDAGSELAAHRPRSAGSRKVCVSFNINSQAFNIPRSLNTETFSLPDCALGFAKHNLASSPSPTTSICSCLQDVMIYGVFPLGPMQLTAVRRREATGLRVQAGTMPSSPGIRVCRALEVSVHGAPELAAQKTVLTLPFCSHQWPRVCGHLSCFLAGHLPGPDGQPRDVDMGLPVLILQEVASRD